MYPQNRQGVLFSELPVDLLPLRLSLPLLLPFHTLAGNSVVFARFVAAESAAFPSIVLLYGLTGYLLSQLYALLTWIEVVAPFCQPLE